MENACEVIGLVKRFGPKTAVDHLRLTIPTGMLYTSADNTAAVALYHSLGFANDHIDRAYRLER